MWVVIGYRASQRHSGPSVLGAGRGVRRIVRFRLVLERGLLNLGRRGLAFKLAGSAQPHSSELAGNSGFSAKGGFGEVEIPVILEVLVAKIRIPAKLVRLAGANLGRCICAIFRTFWERGASIIQAAEGCREVGLIPVP